MELTAIADSAYTDSIAIELPLKDSLLNVFSPLLTSDVIYKSTEISDQANLLISNHQPLWCFLLLFLLFVAIAISQIFFGGLLRGAFQAAVRYSVVVGMFNDNSLVQRQKDNILYIIYFLSAAFLIYIIDIRYSLYPFELSGFLLFLVNIVFLVSLFFARIFVLKLTAHIFNQHRLFNEYLYHSFSLNKLFGILFIPLDFLLVYTSDFVHDLSFYIAFVFVAVLLGMKAVKGIVFSFKKRVFSFYLFLYLCALEIVPILLIYNWIKTVV